MRTLFFLLLLANVAFAAYAYWASQAAAPEQNIMAQQIAPDKIRLVGAAEMARMAGGRKSANACVEWGAFAPADVAKASEALGALAAGVEKRERRAEDAARWWVLIPPLATHNAAVDRVNELKRLGVEEMYVIDDDNDNRNAISLGFFRNEEGARARLEVLQKKGVKDAAVVSRDTSMRVYLQVRNPPEGFRARLAELKAAWPAAEARDCAP